jgi:hypothetical protein
VGGQDIKLIVLKNGRAKDFKLKTQCSAGNGYFLQSTAETFNIPVERFAETAFSAQSMPVFGYGCAVFMQSDIVNFQRQGWRAEEILAGLAAVLPKNVFLYVASIPNLANLGSRFVLQAARKTTWPSSRPRWILSTPASAHPISAPKSSFTNLAANRARSERPSKLSVCGRMAGPRLSSDWMPCARSATGPPAMRTRAAISARTTASGPSST